MECCRCGGRYGLLLSALGVGAYARKEVNFEHEVIEVIDTNLKRGSQRSLFLILDFSTGGLEARIPPTGQEGKAVHGRTAPGIRGEVTQGETRRLSRSDRFIPSLSKELSSGSHFDTKRACSATTCPLLIVLGAILMQTKDIGKRWLYSTPLQNGLDKLTI